MKFSLLLFSAVWLQFSYLFALSINQIPKSQKHLNTLSVKNYGLIISSVFTGILATQLISNKPLISELEVIKTSSLQESKDAVTVVKKCLDGIISMENSLQKSDYDEIGRILSGSEYQEFEKAVTVLVRSPNNTFNIKNNELNMILDWSNNYHYGRLLSIAMIMLNSLKQIDMNTSIDNKQYLKRIIHQTKDSFTDIYKAINPTN